MATNHNRWGRVCTFSREPINSSGTECLLLDRYAWMSSFCNTLGPCSWFRNPDTWQTATQLIAIVLARSKLEPSSLLC